MKLIRTVGADFALDDPAALADWIENQMPSL